nr:MAG TPA: hypothetical protein [Caudoviricetes sp.]
MIVHGIYKRLIFQLHLLKYMWLQQDYQIVPKGLRQITPIML